jgi:UDP-2-acetamido-2,6-beta-L-arabino-hexul-4-ose reductase
MKVLVTGANGFLGTHLVKALSEKPNIHVITYTRNDSLSALCTKLEDCDFIFHLAGVNRPKHDDEFLVSNVELTSEITHFLVKHNISSTIYFSSSIHADKINPYGESKMAAEILFMDLSKKNRNKIIIDRLPGMFGPGARPYYNSVVTTFCYAIANNQAVSISDRNIVIEISYIDDWVRKCLDILKVDDDVYKLTSYQVNLGDLYDILISFKKNQIPSCFSNNKNFIESLYKTYQYYVANL